MSKMIGYGTRLFSRIGNMALGVYNITDTICNLYDKHHNHKLNWDKDSTFQLATSLLSVELLTIDAIDFAHGLNNFDAIKYDIETSQCFVAGTLVLTIDGNKPIEEIQAGDLVYSTDPETGESEYKEVVRAFRKESDVIIHIFVNGEEIETTPQHPFWVEDEWVSAKDLREGDVLTLADGTTAFITKTYGEQLDEPVIVYNFEVQDFHTYYVTDISILVHNDSGCVNFRDGMSPEERNRYDEYWYNVGTQRATEARDAAVNDINSWSSNKRNQVSTVVGAVDLDTGDVAVGIKNTRIHGGISIDGKPLCAEDLAVQQLGGNKPSIVMTSAIRPRSYANVPVCLECQKIYSINQFVEGVKFE